MAPITRRSFLKMALAISATAAWGDLSPSVSRVVWRERRDLFPQGVASGDPDSSSVLLWTHCPQPVRTPEVKLNLEVAEDERFTRVIASQVAPVSEESDWTCAGVPRRNYAASVIKTLRSRREWQSYRSHGHCASIG